MAANINFGAQRRESNSPENFEEVADQTAEQESGAQSQLSQQSSSNADNQAAPEPVAPAEATPPPPVFTRYGLGDTVVMGAPDYARAFTERSDRANQAKPFQDEPGPRGWAFAPVTRAENKPSPAALAANATKPIPVPKPQPAGSIVAGTLTPLASPAATVNAPIANGQVDTTHNPDATLDPDSPPTQHVPYPTSGLRTC